MASRPPSSHGSRRCSLAAVPPDATSRPLRRRSLPPAVASLVPFAAAVVVAAVFSSCPLRAITPHDHSALAPCHASPPVASVVVPPPDSRPAFPAPSFESSMQASGRGVLVPGLVQAAVTRLVQPASAEIVVGSAMTLEATSVDYQNLLGIDAAIVEQNAAGGVHGQQLRLEVLAATNATEFSSRSSGFAAMAMATIRAPAEVEAFAKAGKLVVAPTTVDKLLYLDKIATSATTTSADVAARRAWVKGIVNVRQPITSTTTQMLNFALRSSETQCLDFFVVYILAFDAVSTAEWVATKIQQLGLQRPATLGVPPFNPAVSTPMIMAELARLYALSTSGSADARPFPHCFLFLTGDDTIHGAVPAIVAEPKYYDRRGTFFFGADLANRKTWRDAANSSAPFENLFHVQSLPHYNDTRFAVVQRYQRSVKAVAALYTSGAAVPHRDTSKFPFYHLDEFDQDALLGYVAARFLIQALQRTSPLNITGAAVLDAVYATKLFEVDDVVLGPLSDGCVGMLMADTDACSGGTVSGAAAPLACWCNTATHAMWTTRVDANTGEALPVHDVTPLNTTANNASARVGDPVSVVVGEFDVKQQYSNLNEPGLATATTPLSQCSFSEANLRPPVQVLMIRDVSRRSVTSATPPHELSEAAAKVKSLGDLEAFVRNDTGLSHGDKASILGAYAQHLLYVSVARSVHADRVNRALVAPVEVFPVEHDATSSTSTAALVYSMLSAANETTVAKAFRRFSPRVLVAPGTTASAAATLSQAFTLAPFRYEWSTEDPTLVPFSEWRASELVILPTIADFVHTGIAYAAKTQRLDFTFVVCDSQRLLTLAEYSLRTFDPSKRTFGQTSPGTFALTLDTARFAAAQGATAEDAEAAAQWTDARVSQWLSLLADTPLPPSVPRRGVILVASQVPAVIRRAQQIAAHRIAAGVDCQVLLATSEFVLEAHHDTALATAAGDKLLFTSGLSSYGSAEPASATKVATFATATHGYGSFLGDVAYKLATTLEDQRASQWLTTAPNATAAVRRSMTAMSTTSAQCIGKYYPPWSLRAVEEAIYSTGSVASALASLSSLHSRSCAAAAAADDEREEVAAPLRAVSEPIDRAEQVVYDATAEGGVAAGADYQALSPHPSIACQCNKGLERFHVRPVAAAYPTDPSTVTIATTPAPIFSYAHSGCGVQYKVPAEVPSSSSGISSVALMGMAVGGLLVVLLIAGGLYLLWRYVIHPRCFGLVATRNMKLAPTDPQRGFAMVFTDIEASTTLWARAPQYMSEALDTHHHLMRELVAKHQGYEVKTIGDSFMVAFKDTKKAIDFAIAVQTTFHKHSWGTEAIDDTYKEMRLEKEVESAEQLGTASPRRPTVATMLTAPIEETPNRRPDSVLGEGLTTPENNSFIRSGMPASSMGGKSMNSEKNYRRLWNGVRVRVGVHYGTGNIRRDMAAQGFDYYGTVVNTAARVEGVAHGGQVLITAAALLSTVAPIFDDKKSVLSMGASRADVEMTDLRAEDDDEEEEDELGMSSSSAGRSAASKAHDPGAPQSTFVTCTKRVLLADAEDDFLQRKIQEGNPVSMIDLGAQPLKGLDTHVRLFQVLPNRLATREFPPLRLDKEYKYDEEESSSSDSFGGEGGSSQDGNAHFSDDLSEDAMSMASGAHGYHTPGHAHLFAGGHSSGGNAAQLPGAGGRRRNSLASQRSGRSGGHPTAKHHSDGYVTGDSHTPVESHNSHRVLDKRSVEYIARKLSRKLHMNTGPVGVIILFKGIEALLATSAPQYQRQALRHYAHRWQIPTKLPQWARLGADATLNNGHPEMSHEEKEHTRRVSQAVAEGRPPPPEPAGLRKKSLEHQAAASAFTTEKSTLLYLAARVAQTVEMTIPPHIMGTRHRHHHKHSGAAQHLSVPGKKPHGSLIPNYAAFGSDNGGDKRNSSTNNVPQNHVLPYMADTPTSSRPQSPGHHPHSPGPGMPPALMSTASLPGVKKSAYSGSNSDGINRAASPPPSFLPGVATSVGSVGAAGLVSPTTSAGGDTLQRHMSGGIKGETYHLVVDGEQGNGGPLETPSAGANTRAPSASPAPEQRGGGDGLPPQHPKGHGHSHGHPTPPPHHGGVATHEGGLIEGSIFRSGHSSMIALDQLDRSATGSSPRFSSDRKFSHTTATPTVPNSAAASPKHSRATAPSPTPPPAPATCDQTDPHQVPSSDGSRTTTGASDSSDRKTTSASQSMAGLGGPELSSQESNDTPPVRGGTMVFRTDKQPSLPPRRGGGGGGATAAPTPTNSTRSRPDGLEGLGQLHRSMESSMGNPAGNPVAEAPPARPETSHEAVPGGCYSNNTSFAAMGMMQAPSDVTPPQRRRRSSSAGENRPLPSPPLPPQPTVALVNDGFVHGTENGQGAPLDPPRRSGSVCSGESGVSDIGGNGYV